MTKASTFFAIGGFPRPPQCSPRICPTGMYQFPTYTDSAACVTLPYSSTGTLSLTNSFGTILWTKPVTDINATCDAWGGLFYMDEADLSIWVWGYDAATANSYLAKLNVSTGAVTNVGVAIPPMGLRGFSSSIFEVTRDVNGDFIVRNGRASALVYHTTGAITDTSLTLTDPLYGNYRTVANDLAFGYGSFMGSTSSGTYFQPAICYIERGGVQGKFSVPFGVPLGPCSLWQGRAYICYLGSIYSNVMSPRMWERNVFDIWLHQIADYIGLPPAA